MGKNVVHIRNLGVRLGSEFAVLIEKLDLSVGEVVVLDAESGAGKSTALGLISGAIEPHHDYQDAHVVGGCTVKSGSLRSGYARANQIGFVLQSNVLVPYLSLGENIELPLRIEGSNADPVWKDYVTGRLGLNALLDRRPHQASVGQRQRATLARALIGKPALLLLDEPVSALDPYNSAQVESLIELLAADAGSAVVLASHQAFRGAFAQTRRIAHRMQSHDGYNYSIFSDETPSARQEAIH